jgi:hypothetical protein
MRVACDTIKFLQKKLDSNPTEEFSTKITQELKIMKENSYIDKDTFDYLKPDKIYLDKVRNDFLHIKDLAT